jgi:hypothetical protein
MNTTAGDFSLAGGGGARGAGAGSKEDNGGNAFADALAKLFPQDQNGKPVVALRNPASEGAATEASGAYADSQVYASDLSIFEQITAKYRQLSEGGRL